VAGMGDVDRVASETAFFDPAGTRLFIPAPALQPPEQAGVYDFEAGVCRPILPEEVPELDTKPELPVDVRLYMILGQIWEQIDLLDVLKTTNSLDLQFKATMVKLATNENARGEFANATLDAYSKYVRESAWSTVEMVVNAWKLLVELERIDVVFMTISVEAVIAAVDPAHDVDFNALLAQATVEIPELAPIIAGFARLNEIFRVLRDKPLVVLGAAIDLVTEVQVAILEAIRDTKVRDFLNRAVTDHIGMGTFLGTVLGFILWDVIVDELITLGFGKATRGVRWILR
jgi:hypothetical protein